MISIIVPIYNVEDYLKRCIDSLVNQTYIEFEIILVDDGSTDRSPQICDQYKVIDSRIKVLHIPNGGVANARKCGVEKSNGEFIIFVDPDDWLPQNSLETLISALRKDVDIVMGSFVYKSDKTDLNRFYLPTEMSREEFVIALLTNNIEAFPWRNLYRRNLFNIDSFPSIKRRQDLLMNIKISQRINKVITIDKIVYCYFQRDSSTSYQYKYDFEYEKKYWLTLREQLVNDGILRNYYPQYINRSFQALRLVFRTGNLLNHKDSWVSEIATNIDKSAITLPEKFFLLCLPHRFLQQTGIFVRKIVDDTKLRVKNIIHKK
ncbi:MAG: glycosyltransferase family 2 protein [bacterium]